MIILASGNLQNLNIESLPPIEQKIVRWKQASRIRYIYPSLDSLRFELAMRRHTVEASYLMFNSAIQFAVFSRSRCNPAYWIRTRNGGFLLRPDVSPAAAIRDIFYNGHLYAFECSGAIIILYYKAVLETIGDATFNYYFQNLFLRDWQKDYDLRLLTSYDLNDVYPGDVCYFKNPDHHPLHPEWQGENAVLLDENLYFGHGVGVATAQEIIANLNKARRPGSRISAYLQNLIVKPDFEMLRSLIMYEQAMAVASGDLVLV